MDEKKIAFLLPGRDLAPCGGYKVAYEYANRFAESGYGVSIVYPHVKEKLPFLRAAKAYLGFLLKRRTFRAGEWFDISPKVKKVFVFKIQNSELRRRLENCKVIATAVETSYLLDALTFVPQKDKFYLIQDYEKWNGATDDYVMNSYRLPLTKIVIAKWLQEKVIEAGSGAALIQNGFDFDYFTLQNPIECRAPHEVAMLYHKDNRKRCDDAIAALKIVKRKIPALHVTMFGAPEKPDLPEWFSYFQRPGKQAHNDIYNGAAIFVAASKAEGMALPPAEAMICGCALVCTDIPGFSTYAINGETALTSPVYDYQKLAENIMTLIEDGALRIRLAKNGCEFIRQFTWEKAFSLFRQVIEE